MGLTRRHVLRGAAGAALALGPARLPDAAPRDRRGGSWRAREREAHRFLKDAGPLPAPGPRDEAPIVIVGGGRRGALGRVGARARGRRGRARPRTRGDPGRHGRLGARAPWCRIRGARTTCPCPRDSSRRSARCSRSAGVIDGLRRARPRRGGGAATSAACPRSASSSAGTGARGSTCGTAPRPRTSASASGSSPRPARWPRAATTEGRPRVRAAARGQRPGRRPARARPHLDGASGSPSAGYDSPRLTLVRRVRLPRRLRRAADGDLRVGGPPLLRVAAHGRGGRGGGRAHVARGERLAGEAPARALGRARRVGRARRHGPGAARRTACSCAGWTSRAGVARETVAEHVVLARPAVRGAPPAAGAARARRSRSSTGPWVVANLMLDRAPRLARATRRPGTTCSTRASRSATSSRPTRPTARGREQVWTWYQPFAGPDVGAARARLLARAVDRVARPGAGGPRARAPRPRGARRLAGRAPLGPRDGAAGARLRLGRGATRRPRRRTGASTSPAATSAGLPALRGSAVDRRARGGGDPRGDGPAVRVARCELRRAPDQVDAG